MNENEITLTSGTKIETKGEIECISIEEKAGSLLKTSSDFEKSESSNICETSTGIMKDANLQPQKNDCLVESTQGGHMDSEKDVNKDPFDVQSQQHTCAANDGTTSLVTSHVCADSDSLVHDINKLELSEERCTNIRKFDKIVSEVVVNKQTDSLLNLLSYDSSNDSDSDFEKDWQLKVLEDPTLLESSSDSESDTNEYSESSDNDVVVIRNNETKSSNKSVLSKPSGSNFQTQRSQSALYALEELDKFTVPPVPDLTSLNIDYSKEEFLHIGHVKAIVESLVTVDAMPGTPSYDLDTILFIEDQTSKKPLGAIYDVIGPVISPIYCIRFKNEEELLKQGVKLHIKVFSAPKSQYTNYVFVPDLMKIKGTDASGLDDRELEEEEDDSSGEDCRGVQEQVLKRKRDSLDRHRRFERTMNKCNSLHTRVANLIDQQRSSRKITYNRHSSTSAITSLVNLPPIIHIPDFNPAVPPPNYKDLRNVYPVPIIPPMSDTPQESLFYPPRYMGDPHQSTLLSNIGGYPVVIPSSSHTPPNLHNRPPNPENEVYYPGPSKRKAWYE